MKLDSLNKEANSLIREVGTYVLQKQNSLSDDDVCAKGLHDFVTHVDRESERQLVEGLKKLMPGSGFLAEENTVANTRQEYTWIIDPLDGTTNFIHKLPTFSISVALMKRHEIIMGTVLDVRAQECYYSCEGGPAYLNNKEIHVSDRRKLDESLLATGFPYNDFDHQEAYLKVLAYFMRNTRGVRRFGSAAIDLAWVAAGKFDGFWEYSLKPWGVAAGSFIVKQAGGVVSDFSGGRNYIFGREILCGNPEIFKGLLAIIKQNFHK